MRKKKEIHKYFQFVVDHVDKSWREKKGYGYPFQGRDFSILKAACRSFNEFGTMALWNVFMNSDSEWIKKSGYSISGFGSCLCWLVDDKHWKKEAQMYRDKLSDPIPKEIKDLLNNVKTL